MEKQLQLNSRKNKLKFSVTVTLKKDVLDPQGKVVKNTLINLGMNNLKKYKTGKYFEIEIDTNDESKAEESIDKMCKKLLANLIIEDYTVKKFHEFLCNSFPWFKL